MRAASICAAMPIPRIKSYPKEEPMSPARSKALVATVVSAALSLAACSSDATTTASSTKAASSSSAAATTAFASSAAATTASSSSSKASGPASESSASAAFATSDPGMAAGSGAGKKIVYVPGLTGVPFYSSVSCGAASEATKLGATFSTQGDPTFAVDKQTAVIKALIADKPDAIMISITDPEAMIQPLQDAKAGGIKIIGIDGDLSDESVMSTNIQSDNLIGGATAADALATAMGSSGDVIIIDNATGSLISGARVKGFQDELAAKYPTIEDLGVQYSANAADKAASIASAAATSNPNLKGIFTVETNNTQGAITGISEAGKTGMVKLVGYDTSDAIVQGLHDRTVDGVIVQYPYGEGILGVQSAIKLINGESVDRLQTTPFVVATPANVDTAEVQSYIYKVHC